MECLALVTEKFSKLFMARPGVRLGIGVGFEYVFEAGVAHGRSSSALRRRLGARLGEPVIEYLIVIVCGSHQPELGSVPLSRAVEGQAPRRRGNHPQGKVPMPDR